MSELRPVDRPRRVTVSFTDGVSAFFEMGKKDLLLDAAVRNGINLPKDCREGVCGTCVGLCDSGAYTQDYVDEDTLTPDDLAARKILACQTRVQSDATFSFDMTSKMCSAPAPVVHEVSVVQVRQVSPTTAILKLDGSSTAEQLQFLPGQYARLEVPGAGEYRSYSFANNPNPQNQFEFLVRLLPDGVMSNYLRDRCQVGDVLKMEAPLGSFYLRHVERPIVMAAGGTGLSAFLGMLDDLSLEGGTGHPVHLAYGVTTEADLCETERLAAYAEHIEAYSCASVVMQPGPAWTGLSGLVTDHLDAAALRQRPFDMYVCGPPAMVEAIRTWLADQGIDDCRLYHEKFVHSGALPA